LIRNLKWSLLVLFAGALLGHISPGFAATVTENPASPANGTTRLPLEEMWRIGGEDDEENLLGVIGQAQADDQGNIYLLDLQLTEVMVFDGDGEYVHSLGKQGEGPGELRQAADMVFMPDGTVGLVQGFPGKIVQVDRDGNPAGEYHPGGDDPAEGGFFALRAADSRGGRLVFSGTRITRGDDSRTSVNFVSSFAEDGSEINLYYDQTSVRQFRVREFSEKKEFFPHENGWALGPDGRVFICQPRNSYEITVYTPDGALENTIKRPYMSWKRTAEEMKAGEDSLVPWRRRNRNRLNFVVEPTEPDIAQMRVDDSGRLWVLPSRGLREQPEGVHSTWDVFDTSGRWDQTVAIECEGQGVRDRLFFASEDLVILVKQYADALKAFRGQTSEDEVDDDDDFFAQPLEVICYRIKP
jgi:6-bladed beta-propeller